MLADDSKDFEGGRPRRRACASQVWKLQPVQTYSMKKTAHEFLFYEKNGTSNHILWKLFILYASLWKLSVTFMEISCNLWKFCVTGVSEAGRPLVPTGVIFRPFGVGRGRSGSVGVGWGTGTFSGPIRAPESDWSELWKFQYRVMEIFRGQNCTGSIMEICCT